MKSGAGKGVGLSVTTGSQDGTTVSGGMSSGTATAGSGTVSGTASSSSTSTSKKNAGTTLQPMDKSPLIVGFVVVAFSCLGATLL
jgi:hypothetical protein